MDKLWPAVPEYHGLSTEDVMTDNLSDIGNVIAGHLDLLSHDVIGLKVDGRGQRARLRVGGGDERYLKLKIDSSWLFTNGQAHVNASVDLFVHGHELQVKLPEMDLSHDNYRGEGLVQVNVPLLQRTF